eukprot:scaffold5402_cov40-Tisochrysis_lutea.AAC.1
MTVHRFLMTSQRRTPYLPRMDTSFWRNRLRSSPGNSARHAAAARSQQSPKEPWPTSEGRMPSRTKAMPFPWAKLSSELLRHTMCGAANEPSDESSAGKLVSV